MALRALNLLPVPAQHWPWEAAPHLHLPKSNIYVRGEFQALLRERVFKNNTTAAWKYAQIFKNQKSSAKSLENQVIKFLSQNSTSH